MLSPFSGLHPLLTLVPLSALAGTAMLWAFRHSSDQRAIRCARNRMAACIFEMRLYPDEPSVILAAQRGLLAANGRLLLLLLRPIAILALPFAALTILLDPFYGSKPLAVHEPALVVMQVDGDVRRGVGLRVPDGFAVEAGPVRSVADNQVTWRIRPLRHAAGELHIQYEGASILKAVEARPGARYVSSRRTSHWGEWLLSPIESRLNTPGVRWVDVRYESANIALLGWEMHWTLWFLLISMATAFLFKRRMGVAF